MRDSGFRRWMWLGGAAAAALLSVGCGRLEQTGGGTGNEPPLTFFGSLARSERGGDLDRYHVPKDRGYNGTIVDIGSSIDPRTPETEGTPGRTRLTDITGYMGRPDIVQGYSDPPTSLGIGGSGQVDSMTGAAASGWRTRPESVPLPVQGQSGGAEPVESPGSGTE